MTDLTGQSIGRYQITGLLGEGGMAIVYKAFDTRLERDVAIKIIRRSAFSADMIDQLLKRFEREAKSLARMSHPNIVNVFDFGEFEGSPYLVMEYIAGGNLKDRMGKALPWQEAVRLILPVARALAYVHQSNVIHRDIKPSNIMLTRSGDPMLADFGIAKILDVEGLATLTGTGMGIGTPEYMSPEQGMGQPVDGRTDVYGLGVVLYELVTGRRPFEADTPMQVIFKHLTDPLPPPRQFVPDLPETVEAVLIKALAKKPEERYETMDAFVAALEKFPLTEKTAPSPVQTASDVATEIDGFSQTVPDSRIPVPKAMQATPASTRQAAQPKPIPPRKINKALLAAGVVLVFGLAVIGLAIWGISAWSAGKARQTQAAMAPGSNLAASSSLSGEITDLRGIVMKLVPSGTFEMGNNSGYPNEKPAITITLDAFYIDPYEVTNSQYRACVKAGVCSAPSSFQSNIRNNYYDNDVYSDYPVIYVNWRQARTFCEDWRQARLPTEAEWEKAARGGLVGKLYPWGDSSPVCEVGAANGANYASCSQDTWAVGKFGANGFGLYDMAGNVWEWTSSLYQQYPYSALDGRENLAASGDRVARGGGLDSSSSDLRSVIRLSAVAEATYDTIGFRCASTPTH